MTKEEFEKKIGRELSDKEFLRANALYMACAMDIEDFCKDYKEHSCELLSDIIETLNFEVSQRKHSDETLYALVDCILSKVNESEICGKHLAALREEARIAIVLFQLAQLLRLPDYALRYQGYSVIGISIV